MVLAISSDVTRINDLNGMSDLTDKQVEKLCRVP